MTILLVGLNHRTAPVELREKLALDTCAPEAAYAEMNAPAIDERVYLSTCNRVEILVTTSDPEAAYTGITAWLGARQGLAPGDFEHALYRHVNAEAVRHVFRVASSLDSMVLGEPQILGQLKNSFRQSVDHKSTGPILNKLMHKSFSVAKRVRTETGIASHAVSISYAAVELARKIFGELDGKKVLLVGAGEMAELAAEHLLGNGASGIMVANRTLDRAMLLAKRFKGEAASLDELPRLLAQADIVISSTGATELVVKAPLVKSVLKARRHRPLFFVDIAVPRDVDPDVNRLDNVYLYDIDDLQSVIEENRAARQEEAVRAERIVAEEVLSFMSWLETLETFPTIVALREKIEAIRTSEIKKTIGKLKNLEPDEAAAIEVMTRSLVQKILHDPILFIKSAGRHGRKDFNLDLARRILGLDLESPSDEEAESSEDDLQEPRLNHGSRSK